MNIADYKKSAPLLLVVDDDKIMRMQVRKVMEKAGYQVAEACDGSEGLATYINLQPDIVLLDALMPQIDGFTCCRLLRSLPKSEHIPILMLTSLDDEPSVDRAFEAGATDYITKPIHPAVLRQRVRRIHLASQAMEELRQQSQREHLIRTITESIRQSLDLQTILDTTVREVQQFLNCDRVLFYRVWSDGSGKVVSEKAVFGISKILGEDITDPCFKPSFLELYRQGRVRAVHDLHQADLAPCYIEFLQQFEVKAHLVVPVLQGESFWGLLIAHHCSAARVWSNVEIELLQQLASQVSIALAQAQHLQTIKTSKEELAKALEKEKELSELKSRFVTMASHEFRTPLTSILSSTELLDIFSHKLSEEKKGKHLQRIKAAVRTMTVLLDEVLIFSKAEAGKLNFQPTWFDIKSFCREIVEEMQFNAGEKYQISFISSGTYTNVFMDQKLVQHILTNLISNAIKYSPKGGNVRFELNCEPEFVRFRIEDQGIGIPAKEQSQLFNAFNRASNVSTISGTGLGLAIVKKCVDLHKGRINLQSEVEVGTTFEVMLPSIVPATTGEAASYRSEGVSPEAIANGTVKLEVVLEN